MRLTDFDIDAFLRHHWQQQPLLIRNPWPDWANPLEPDELAGLACEPEMESRLIIGGNGKWQVEHGPFRETYFTGIGPVPWTLLVQAVDHHVAGVAALLDPFRFIPNWRIDDVMVSYATEGGGVGPHYDQYDVFLIQGLGKRRWRIGQSCTSRSALMPHEDLRLLADFETTDEFVLEPGDILYVPPGIAHDGVAVGGDCMTYSIGFRAPSRSELIEDFTDALATELEDDDRFTDPGFVRQENPGEISPSALNALRQMILDKMSDEQRFARWFGEWNSTPKYPEVDWRPENVVGVDQVTVRVTKGTAIARNPASRFSFIRQEAEKVLMFVDGKSYQCDAALAETLCANDHLTLDKSWASSTSRMQLIATLINLGSLAFDEED